ncbi:hypothetical protein PM082_018528 [Marasmius tenuissimus]|nr:hypothetical protein PM082_018528 [Marasmius tenuissimus]
MCEPKKRRIGKSVPTSFVTCPSVVLLMRASTSTNLFILLTTRYGRHEGFVRLEHLGRYCGGSDQGCVSLSMIIPQFAFPLAVPHRHAPYLHIDGRSALSCFAFLPPLLTLFQYYLSASKSTMTPNPRH